MDHPESISQPWAHAEHLCRNILGLAFSLPVDHVGEDVSALAVDEDVVHVSGAVIPMVQNEGFTIGLKEGVTLF